MLLILEDVTGKSFKSKELAGRPSKSLIPKDRGRGTEGSDSYFFTTTPIPNSRN
jgi:hypothetical protein